MEINRRNFVLSSGLGALATCLPTNRLATAGPLTTGDKHFFLLLRAYGGWDVTLGLDPWTASALPDPQDMFIEYRPDDLVQIGPNMRLGPACAQLKPHAGKFSVVNGVFMSQIDNGHPASMLYITTGSTRASSPSLPVEMARATFEGDFGVIYNGGLDMGNRTLGTSTVTELKELPGRTELDSLLRSLFNFEVKSPFLSSVSKVIESGPSTRLFNQTLLALGKPDELSNPQVVAAAFKSEVASSAQLDLGPYNLDSHSDHEGNHLAQQTQVWTDVAAIFSLFQGIEYGAAGKSLFDHTTFLVVSEFARTPALNGSGGKDHNPMTNSVLIASPGIGGGKVVGASRLVTRAMSPTGEPYHIAYPIDYDTGAVQTTRTPTAKMIFPENVGITLAKVMGADPKKFESIEDTNRLLNWL
ncbi:MAG: DUF1501 domain-containing protein [Bdellovibrionales bacterium]